MALLSRVLLLAGLSLAVTGCDWIGDRLGPGEPSEPVETTPVPGVEPGAADEGVEVEPNDIPEEASSVALGDVLSGRASDEDRDLIVIDGGDLPVAIAVDVELSTSVRVHRTQTGAVIELPLPAGAQSIGPFAADGRLMIEIVGAGAWSVRPEAAPDAALACGFAVEPDGATRPGASIASIPGSVSGCIGEAGDVDTIELAWTALAEHEVIGIKVDGVEGVSLNVAIHDVDGTELTAVSAGPGQSVTLPNLRRPIAPGALTLRVSSLAGANETVPYRLHVTLPPSLRGTLEAEPNDDIATAVAITVPGIVYGWLHRADDADHFALTTQEDGVVRVNLIPPPGVDAQLRVLDREGVLLSAIDEAGEGQPEGVCALRVPSDEPVYLAVAASVVRGVSPESAYQLQFDRLAADNYEREPNDVTERLPAGPPSRGGPRVAAIVPAEGEAVSAITGHIFPPSDVDLFAVDVVSAQGAEATYSSVQLRLEPNAPADYKLEFLDEDGVALAVADDTGIAEPEVVRLDLPSGRYVARVTLRSGDGCDAAYRLSVGAPPERRPTALVFPGPAAQEGSGPRQLNAAEGSGTAPASSDEAGGGQEAADEEDDEEGAADAREHDASEAEDEVAPARPRRHIQYPPSPRQTIPQRAPRVGTPVAPSDDQPPAREPDRQ